MDILTFLKTSYTAYHAVENAAAMLKAAGFCELSETDAWNLKEGGAYYVVRGGASIIAFRYRRGAFSIVASHTDSPCLKLKENAALTDGTFTRLNTEPYGGGLWYTFFDRPLRIAGRIVRADGDKLSAAPYVSPYRVVLPSLAIHMDREANSKFAPNLQTELPVLTLGKRAEDTALENVLAYDLFAVCDEEPFLWGERGEFLSSPRLDDLAGVYTSLAALIEEKDGSGTTLAACLNSEEIGSLTYGGAGSDFLRAVLGRIAQGHTEEDGPRLYANSFLVSLDNAHSLHPNHPEKCDPTNRAVMGGGVVIKGHAGGAYTTDAVSMAVVKHILARAGIPFQTFYNRSDMRSGSTLGAISTGQVSIRAADLGIAQLAMHSAVETVAMSDIDALQSALRAFYAAHIDFTDGIRIL